MKFNKRYPNHTIQGLKWLRLFFFMYFIQGFLSLLESDDFSINIGFIMKSILISTNLVVLLFVRDTFYQDKKSPFKILLLVELTLVFIFIALYSNRQNSISLFYGTISLNTFTIWISTGWLYYSANHALIPLQNLGVEPWIIKRYRLIKLSAILNMIKGGLNFGFPYFPGDSSLPENESYLLQSVIVAFIVSFIALIFIVLNYHIWIKMGNSKKKTALNQEENDLDEEALTAQFLQSNGGSLDV